MRRLLGNTEHRYYRRMYKFLAVWWPGNKVQQNEISPEFELWVKIRGWKNPFNDIHDFHMKAMDH